MMLNVKQLCGKEPCAKLCVCVKVLCAKEWCVEESWWKNCVCVCGTKLCARVVHGRVDRERAAGKELYLAMKTVTSVT